MRTFIVAMLLVASPFSVFAETDTANDMMPVPSEDVLKNRIRMEAPGWWNVEDVAIFGMAREKGEFKQWRLSVSVTYRLLIDLFDPRHEWGDRTLVAQTYKKGAEKNIFGKITALKDGGISISDALIDPVSKTAGIPRDHFSRPIMIQGTEEESDFLRKRRRETVSLALARSKEASSLAGRVKTGSAAEAMAILDTIGRETWLRRPIACAAFSHDDESVRLETRRHLQEWDIEDAAYFIKSCAGDTAS